MRSSRMKKAVILCAAALLLSGCGEAPYELTESEESLIVNYASQAVAKFNIKQKDGLTYVDVSALEEDTQETEEPESEEPQTTEEPENQSDAGTSDGTTDSNDTETATGKSLQEVFGADGLSVTYAGYELTKDYVESDYFALEASAGKQYLVLNIDLANTGDTDLPIDVLALQPTFQVTADGEVIPAAVTFLMNDFSTYQGTVAAGDTVRTVLLFEISDTKEDVSELSLNATINGEKVTIML